MYNHVVIEMYVENKRTFFQQYGADAVDLCMQLGAVNELLTVMGGQLHRW